MTQKQQTTKKTGGMGPVPMAFGIGIIGIALFLTLSFAGVGQTAPPVVLLDSHTIPQFETELTGPMPVSVLL